MRRKRPFTEPDRIKARVNQITLKKLVDDSEYHFTVGDAMATLQKAPHEGLSPEEYSRALSIFYRLIT